MKVAILEDYQQASPALACFASLATHEITVIGEPLRDEAALAGRVRDCDALVLIRQRTRVSRTLLERLPRPKLLVQTARIGPRADLAACLERGALEQALRECRSGRAALDVFEDEPGLDPAHPLIHLPGVTATPHLGCVERANCENCFGDAFDAINAFAAGQPLRVVGAS